MATVHLDVNMTAVDQNKFYKTRATVWTEDKEPRAVFYSIGPNTTAEVWEGGSCISVDLTFAIAYLRGAGFKDNPMFETFADYTTIMEDLDKEFDEARYNAMPKPEEKEMPF